MTVQVCIELEWKLWKRKIFKYQITITIWVPHNRTIVKDHLITTTCFYNKSGYLVILTNSADNAGTLSRISQPPGCWIVRVRLGRRSTAPWGGRAIQFGEKVLHNGGYLQIYEGIEKHWEIKFELIISIRLFQLLWTIFFPSTSFSPIFLRRQYWKKQVRNKIKVMPDNKWIFSQTWFMSL